jgi:hypothetical protein
MHTGGLAPGVEQGAQADGERVGCGGVGEDRAVEVVAEVGGVEDLEGGGGEGERGGGFLGLCADISKERSAVRWDADGMVRVLLGTGLSTTHSVPAHVVRGASSVWKR